jgi:hypothetical protein
MYSLALIIFVVSEKKEFGKNVSKCFFSETTWTVETKLPRNDHWKVLYKVSLSYADRKSKVLMNIHVQFGFNHICSFWEEGIWIFRFYRTYKVHGIWYCHLLSHPHTTYAGARRWKRFRLNIRPVTKTQRKTNEIN